MICDWGSLFYSRDSRFMSLIDSRYLWNSQKWQILISVNRDLDFFIFLSMTRTPPPSPLPPLKKVFVYGKGVQNTCRTKFTNIFFFNFHLYVRRHEIFSHASLLIVIIIKKVSPLKRLCLSHIIKNNRTEFALHRKYKLISFTVTELEFITVW